jgi:DNA-binding transcriptional ArsR family regulator
MAKRAKMRLVGSPDPATMFDDLDALREAQRNPAPQRRQRTTETFARIPHGKALALYRQAGGSPWMVLVELDRLVLKSRGKNPVKLFSARLRGIGISHRTRQRALRMLEAAGVVRVEQQGKGQPPLVLHLWYPRQE